MKSDALSGSQPNFPDPHSICFGQQSSADVAVELVWDPPWNQAMMTEAAKLQLGLL